MSKKFSLVLVVVLALSLLLGTTVFSEEYSYPSYEGFDSMDYLTYELDGERLIIRRKSYPDTIVFTIDGILEEVGSIKRSEFNIGNEEYDNPAWEIKDVPHYKVKAETRITSGMEQDFFGNVFLKNKDGKYEHAGFHSRRTGDVIIFPIEGGEKVVPHTDYYNNKYEVDGQPEFPAGGVVRLVTPATYLLTGSEESYSDKRPYAFFEVEKEMGISKEIQEAGEFLKNKAILRGNKDGDLELNKYLTRKDTTIILSALMGKEKEAASFTGREKIKAFNDLKEDYAINYVAWAVENGYFSGKNDLKFAPGDNLSAREYALVLMKAIGFEDKIGDWNTVFGNARELGIFKNLENITSPDKGITRGEMSLMTLNALNLK